MKTIQTAIHTLFPSLSETAITKLIENARINTYPPNHMIIHQGEMQGDFYILLEGSVDIYQTVHDRRYYLDRLHAYTWFGELALLLDIPRTADVVAHESIQVLQINQHEFEEYVHSNPEVVLAVTKIILQKFLKQEERLMLQISETKQDTLPDVFISYSHDDNDFVTQLTRDLQRYDFKVWKDTKDIVPGTVWDDEIDQALDHAETMILVLSHSSVESRAVRAEWHHFLATHKTLIPILIEPSVNIPKRLRIIQYLDFVSIDYEYALPQLVKALQSHALNKK